jgi:hypothetical protein
MGKTKTVKWSASEPEDLQDFQSNDDILRKNKGKQPPRGVTRLRLKKVTDTKNKNKERMLKIIVEIDEPKGAPGYKWNGWALFENQNVTDQGAPYLKRFLTAIGVTWADFTQRCVVEEDGDGKGNDVIVKIGSLNLKKLDVKPLYVWAALKMQPAKGDYEEKMAVGRWLAPREDEDFSNTDDDDESSDADAAVDMSVDDKKSKKGKGKKAKSKKSDDGGKVDDPNGLKKLKRPQLEARAKDNGRKAKKIKSASDDELRDWIISDENLPPF